jgi:SAM-dependent methyltransferase
VTVIWHDLECGGYVADLPLWRELAGDRGGPILDVGAGTGRVALELARNGHEVTALDRDPEFIDELRRRVGGLPVTTVLADARSFELHARFPLCIVPMQTLQLLGGVDGRARFLRSARAHLVPGGLLACAIVTDVDAFDCDDGDAGPSPETVRLEDVTYVSRATRVHIGREVVRIERERSVLAPGVGSARPQLEHDVVELARVSVAQLQREGREVGLASAGTRAIPATEEHTASVAVMFRA